MDGIINFHKESGISSQRAVNIVKRMTGVKKAGHTGTLDPLASGVLPILLNGSTSFAELITAKNKIYRAEILLGKTSDTLDITGEILQESKVAVTFDDICDAAKKYVGDISQIPPMYSAIKKDGQTLYKLARKGIVTERESRNVTIHNIDVEKTRTKNCYALTVSCGKGTYIRSLCDDIGRDLGCGALMKSLCRINAEPFDIKDSVTVSDLEKAVVDGMTDKYIIKTDSIFTYLDSRTLDPFFERLVLNGCAVLISKLNFEMALGDVCRLYDADKTFLGIAKCILEENELCLKMFKRL